MEIQEFLELSAGKWFSQRSSYHFEQDKAESKKSELTIEALTPNSQEVVALCQDYQIAPTSSLGGTKVSWDTSGDWGETKQSGSAIIVLVRDTDNSKTGRILRAASHPQASRYAGKYILGNDEALTLIVEEDSLYLEERLWFASPNLRLRTSIIKSSHGNATAFYSEIRKLPPQ